MRSEFLPYGQQWVNDEDIKAVVEVLKTDWITQGPKVDEFERRVAEYCGAKYAVAVSSGTAALHATCTVAGISEGDEDGFDEVRPQFRILVKGPIHSS